MTKANFNLSSLGAARHSPQKGKARMQCFRATLLAELALKRQFGKDFQKGKARREGDLRYNFTLFQGGENIGKHFVFALSAVHYDEAFFVFPRLL